MGLARKAGKLVYGYDTVKHAIMTHKARLVLTASDLSPKTRANIEFFCRDKVRHIAVDRTMEQMSTAVGKAAGVVAVLDEGFAKLIQGYITDIRE